MSYNNNNNNEGSNVQGEAASYYAAAAQQTQQHYQGIPPQSDNEQQERGFLGAVGGGIVGGVGGNKIGNKTGHSKIGTVLGVVAGAIAGHKTQDGIEEWKDKRDEKKEAEKREEEERRRREEDEERYRRDDDERRKRDDEDRRRRDDEDRRRREEEDRRRASEQQQHHHQSHQSRDGGAHYAGNFSGSAKDIRLDAHGEFMLHCECRRMDGGWQRTSISLNSIIENSDGNFRWSSGGGGGNSCRPDSVTVQPGDTLRDIGQRHGTTWQELAQINCLQNPDLIHPGQVIKLPGGGGHGGGGGGNFGASARNVRLEDCGKRLVGELRRGDGCWVSSSITLDERIGNENGNLRFK